MTDSSSSNSAFPPWSFSKVHSVPHFILFTQQSFSEPCRTPSTLPGLGMQWTEGPCSCSLGAYLSGDWLPHWFHFLIGSQPSLCAEHRRHSRLSRRVSLWNLCAMYFLCMHEHTSLLTTTINVPSMWFRKQWLNKSIEMRNPYENTMFLSHFRNSAQYQWVSRVLVWVKCGNRFSLDWFKSERQNIFYFFKNW